MPAYNAAPLIAATIRSVIAQTEPSWELIIADDGSTDTTPDIAEASGDARVQVLRLPHSGLPAVARNRGIAQARGSLIAFLDADDLWEPDKLAHQVAYLERYSQVGMVFSRYYVWFDHRRRPRAVTPDLRRIANPGRLFYRLWQQNLIGTSTVLVRRSMLETFGCFDEEPRLRGVEDYELWLRLALHMDVGYVEQPLCWYRIHGVNLSSNETAIFEGRLLALTTLLRKYPWLQYDQQLVGSRMAARKLRWRAHACLKDGFAEDGRRALVQSLKIWPADRETWLLLLVSMLGSRIIRKLRALSRWIG